MVFLIRDNTVFMKKSKKLVQINTVCNGSTGRIMYDIQKHAKEKGWDTISFVGRRKVYDDLLLKHYTKNS